MEKTTQKEIKRLIRLGAAIELTYNDRDRITPGQLDKIAMSFGIYGMNGAIFKDSKTGQLYAIPGRSTALFYYC